MRLLLVEDSRRLQRSLGLGLRQAGYAVDVTRDGRDAFWRASTVPYDAVIFGHHDFRTPMKKSLFLFFFVSWGLALEAQISGPTPAQTRTPDQLVAEALTHNPELKATEAELEAARGIRLQAGLWKNPDISGSYAWRQVRSPGANNDGFSDQLSITQTFEFPGKATLRKAIADQDVALGEIGLTQFRSALAGRVELLAYRYGLAEQNREAADLVVARSRALIALLNKRPKAGLQAMFDAGILEGNLEDLAVTQHDLALEASSSLSELNSLRGWPLQTPLKVILPAHLPSLPNSLDRLLMASLSSSPILQMREMDLKKARLQVKASKLDPAPDFAIGPFYSLDKAGDHDQKIGASITFPLPVWNQNQGNIANSKAALTKTEATQEQARRDLELSITKIYQSRQLLDAQMSQAKPELLQNLAQLADMADRQYRLGAINLTTFLEVQRQFLSTAKSVRQTVLDANSLNLDLQLLTGTMPQGTSDGSGKP
jgi:cobalt-zinc-cadmium efflux system outer membrane protein